MTQDELSLLNWLSTGYGQYGECYGKTLDAVMASGLAEWKRSDSRGVHYGWVGLTANGRNALNAGRATCPHPYKAADRYGELLCGVCGASF